MARFSLLLGSIHDYHDVQHFVDELEHIPDIENVNCAFLKEKHHFRLSFDSTDEEKAVLNLIKAMQAYEEHYREGEEEDATGQLKVSLTSDARLKEELDAMYEAVEQKELLRFEEETTPTQPAFLIDHEAFEKSWALDSKAPALLLTRKFLSGLEQAWNVRVEIIDMTVTVFADDRRMLVSAIEGFKACQQTMMDRERRRHFFDFHNDEDEVGRFYRARFPSSTADHDLSRRSFLSNNIELIMVKWDDRSRQYISMPQQTRAILAHERSCLWPVLFKFQFGDAPKKRDKLGGEEGCHITNLPAIETMKMDAGAGSNAQVKSWLETNSHGSSTTEGNHSSVPSSQHSHDQASVTASAKSKTMSEQLQGVDALQHDDLMKTGYIRPSRFGAKRIEESVEAPLAALPQLIGPNNYPSKSITLSHPTSGVAAIHDQDESLTPKVLHFADFPALPPVQDANPQTFVGAIGAWNTNRPAGLQLKGPANIQRPAELPKKSSVTEDCLITISDQDKRCYHPQGSQRVSRHEAKPKPFDLSLEVWKALRTTLNGAKLHNSVTRTAKLEIGKIFISTTSIPSQWRPSKVQPATPFKPEHWSEVFHAHRDRGGAITVFSPRVTDRWADAEHIIELEATKNAKIFTSARDDGMPEQHTRLRIHCRDKREGIDAVVEIDENKKTSIYAADTYLVGSVNIHYPKRAWDARIVIEEQPASESWAIQRFRSLAEALCVRAPRRDKHLKHPIVSAEKDPRIDIISVEFQRDVVYSIDGQYHAGAQLHLTQVQSLWVNSESTNFSAYLQPERVMLRDGQLWWTVHISSQPANLGLQRDAVDLRIGEHPKAEAVNKLEKPVQQLLGLANLLVPLMDPIGMHTSFHRSSGSSSSLHKGGSSSRGGRSHGYGRVWPWGATSQISGL